jgi:hypothetical protein
MGYDSNLEFLMTHPHNDNRIKDILNHQTPAGFEEKPFTIDWKAGNNHLTMKRNYSCKHHTVR